jgi:hypothetical protein
LEDDENFDFWGRSKASKNFMNGVAVLPNKRKRNLSKINLTPEQSRKRRKRSQSARWVPQIGDEVSIAYDKDCNCGLDLLECRCDKVWYRGISEISIRFFF